MKKRRKISRKGRPATRGLKLDELPEGCIASIISLTSPREASRCAMVSKVFRSAADSDMVWKSFLPSNYQEISSWLSNSNGAPNTNLFNSLSKKQLYFRLFNEPLLIDGGSKSFALDKLYGKKIYMLAAKSLFIAWGDDPRYWMWTSMQDSRFEEVARLLSVCWLEIRGKIKISMLSPNVCYSANLVFKLEDDSYGFPSLFEGSIRIAGGKIRTMDLHIRSENWRPSGRHHHRVLRPNERIPYLRLDGWLEIEMGVFLINDEEDGDIDMAVLEVETQNWKSGLIVQGFEIRPIRPIPVGRSIVSVLGRIYSYDEE